MKNLLKNVVVVALTFSVLCCNDNSDPKPNPKSATTPEDASFASNQSARMQDPEEIDKKIEYRFNWQMVKTVTIKNDQTLTLKTPFLVGNYRGGDLAWKIDDAYFSALIPLNSQFINFGFFDKSRITKDFLNAQTFNSNTIWAAKSPANDYDPLRLVNNTQIACKTFDGKYYLLRVSNVKFHESITMGIYEGFDVAP